MCPAVLRDDWCFFFGAPWACGVGVLRAAFPRGPGELTGTKSARRTLISSPKHKVGLAGPSAIPQEQTIATVNGVSHTRGVHAVLLPRRCEGCSFI